jgi:hypothetical protein
LFSILDSGVGFCRGGCEHNGLNGVGVTVGRQRIADQLYEASIADELVSGLVACSP